MQNFYDNIQKKFGVYKSSNNVTVELCIRLRELGFNFYTEFKVGRARFDIVVFSKDNEHIIACIEIKQNKHKSIQPYYNGKYHTLQAEKYMKLICGNPLFKYADLLFCLNFNYIESVAQAVRAAQAKYEKNVVKPYYEVKYT